MMFVAYLSVYDIDVVMYNNLGLQLRQSSSCSPIVFGRARKLRSTGTRGGRLTISELCKMLGNSFWYSIEGDIVHYIKPSTSSRNLKGLWVSVKHKQTCSIGNYSKQHTRKQLASSNPKTIQVSSNQELRLTFTVDRSDVATFCNNIFVAVMGPTYPTPLNLIPYSNRIVID